MGNFSRVNIIFAIQKNLYNGIEWAGPIMKDNISGMRTLSKSIKGVMLSNFVNLTRQQQIHSDKYN